MEMISYYSSTDGIPKYIKMLEDAQCKLVQAHLPMTNNQVLAITSTAKVEEFIFEWEGRDRQGRILRGELRAAGENQVQASLRR